MSNNAPGFADAIIGTYYDLGTTALLNGRYEIAETMYKAALAEPAPKKTKSKFVLPLLLCMARTHEGRRRHYKAKLLYIRALAHYKRHFSPNDATVVEILCLLARVNAKQGLFKQASEFVAEACQHWRQNPEPCLAAIMILNELYSLLDQRQRRNELTQVSELLNQLASAEN